MNTWKSFDKKVALITGASSGIGEALANELVAKGAEVILVARSKNKLEEIALSIQKKGGKATVIALDLGVPGAAEKLYDQVAQLGLKVDLLINNAGYGRWGEFDKFEISDYNQMIQLNVTTLTELCRLFAVDMVNRKDGGIINVSSLAGFGATPYGAVYSASKSFVLFLSEALNYEYRDLGIQVMALCPGSTETNFLEVAVEKSSATTKDNAMTSMNSGSSMTSAAVAKECLESFLKGRIYRITGGNNRLTYAATKLMSRKIALGIVGNIFKKVVKG
jgi:short-subunit dehydrogenase